MITPATIFERTPMRIANRPTLDTACTRGTAIPSDRRQGQRRPPGAQGSVTADSGRLAHAVSQS